MSVKTHFRPKLTYHDVWMSHEKYFIICTWTRELMQDGKLNCKENY